MFKAHTLGNLVGSLLVNQLSEQFVGVGESCCRTLGGGDVTIYGYQVACIAGTILG